jgi:hypothetical protein
MWGRKAVAFADVLAEAIEESDLILVVFEDGRSIEPAAHDVMHGTGDIQAGLSGHKIILLNSHHIVKKFCNGGNNVPNFC